MAYLVSQLRKSNVAGDFMTPVGVTNIQVPSSNPFGQTKNFTDFALRGTFSQTNVYYLRFRIHKIPQYYYSGLHKETMSTYSGADQLRLELSLANYTGNENEILVGTPQVIGTCTVPVGVLKEGVDNNNETYYYCDEYSSYSFVFSPSITFNTLVFKINRVSFDAIQDNQRKWLIEEVDSVFPRYRSSDDESGIEIRIFGDRVDYQTEGQVCLLNNIIQNNQNWIKFGYQSRPGSLIVVNGQPIRVGRSGIYEINNGTVIQKFMIASPGGSNRDNIDAFLLDYAYKG